MITPEEMREMAGGLDLVVQDWINGSCFDNAADCARAAQMLRSIAAEREAEAKRRNAVP